MSIPSLILLRYPFLHSIRSITRETKWRERHNRIEYSEVEKMNKNVKRQKAKEAVEVGKTTKQEK